jgi:hypothetical protein
MYRSYFKIFTYLSIACLICFLNTTSSFAQYSITQLTDNPFPEGGPKINNSGEVVWGRWDGNDGEIIFYDGTAIIQLTNNDLDDDWPQINNSGEVVWEGRVFNGNPLYSIPWQIFLFDGTSITQLTDNDFDDNSPQINDNGDVVWVGYDGDDEIMLYDGTTTTQLTNNNFDDKSPQVNNRGEVVWVGFSGPDSDIFLYDGSEIIKITNDDPCNVSAPDWCPYDSDPQINNRGEIVWTWSTRSNSGIIFYDGIGPTEISYSNYYEDDPQISSKGEIVWGRSGSVYEPENPYVPMVIYYDNTGVIQLAEWARNPQINSKGQVVWSGHDGNDYEIFIYDGAAITQITDNNFDDHYPQINDNGEVTWQGGDGIDTEIFLAIPTGIDEILNFFDDAVAAGSIEGRGQKPKNAKAKLRKFEKKLESVEKCLDKNKIKKACKKLKYLYRRSDLDPKPKDLIIGGAVPELSEMILDLREIVCQ